MNGVAAWVDGTSLVLLALFGLFIASRAADGPSHVFGLAVFLFGILCVFGLIARATHAVPSAHRDG